jgi:hypothetical protein
VNNNRKEPNTERKQEEENKEYRIAIEQNSQAKKYFKLHQLTASTRQGNVDILTYRHSV